jgi:hypothetical protein
MATTTARKKGAKRTLTERLQRETDIIATFTRKLQAARDRRTRIIDEQENKARALLSETSKVRSLEVNLTEDAGR